MGCGFSCFSRTQVHHQDIHLETIEPTAKHRENIDEALPENGYFQEHEEDRQAATFSSAPRADLSAAQRREVNHSQPISVGSVSSLNSVIYFL